MTLALPNLDDRRWDELVAEGRALIPVYAPEWTDHNIHDPGITLLELFAWIAEMDIYQANRIPDGHRRKYLSLAGVTPQATGGARMVVATALQSMSPPVKLPADSVLAGRFSDGTSIGFRLRAAMSVLPLQLGALQVGHGSRLTDFSDANTRGESTRPFGPEPKAGDTLYIGLESDGPLTAGMPLHIYFQFADSRIDERQQLREQRRDCRMLCRPPDSLLRCDGPVAENHDTEDSAAANHHSVRTVWEYSAGSGNWRSFTPNEIGDETRAFTLDGQLVVPWPNDIASTAIGQVATSLFYLRCRLVSGRYDAAPELAAMSLNGAEVDQTVDVGELVWPVAHDATVTGPAPIAGKRARFVAQFNSAKQISAITFADSDAPEFLILDYRAPVAGQAGRIVVEASEPGIGTGRPFQQFKLPETFVAGATLRLTSLQDGVWREWLEQPDFVRSERVDWHFVLDAGKGEILFGDGEHGRVIGKGARLVATYRSTLGERGNVDAGADFVLADSAHNKAIVSNYPAVAASIGTISNPRIASGGSAGESLAAASARAADAAAQTERAVTLADYEALAMRTPGVRLARVSARPNRHPEFPCYHAPGLITLIVLPFLPSHRPAPTRALVQTVRSFLASRRVVGTRVEVVGPVYVEILVRARVRACATVDSARLAADVLESLKNFFDPLTGGPGQSGWPFGRDVYRSEVLQVIDETLGTDHVLDLDLVSGDKVSCGNICVPPNGLVDSGNHEIEILRAES